MVVFIGPPVGVATRPGSTHQVGPADAVQQCWMVGTHVLADLVDDLVVGVAPGDEPAFASDQPGHRYLHAVPTATVLPQCWRDLGVVTRDAGAAVRTARHRARRGTVGV